MMSDDNTTATPITALCARHIMTATVVTLTENLSLNEVKRIFYRQNISGAPVVDEQGQLIGVLSKSDLMKEQIAIAANVLSGRFVPALNEADDSQTHHPEEMLIGHFITRQVISATPDTPVIQLARLMLHHNIHRLIIIKPESREPIGVVSSFDMMRAMIALQEGQRLDKSHQVAAEAEGSELHDPLDALLNTSHSESNDWRAA